MVPLLPPGAPLRELLAGADPRAMLDQQRSAAAADRGVRPMQHPADRVPGGLGRLLAIATLPPTTRVGERHFPAFGRATGEADPARNALGG